MLDYYSVLSDPDIATITFAIQTTSLLGIPTILHCLRKNSTVFEDRLFSLTFLASFIFHFCEILCPAPSLIIYDKVWLSIDYIIKSRSWR
jgi:hypothetical protein